MTHAAPSAPLQRLLSARLAMAVSVLVASTWLTGCQRPPVNRDATIALTVEEDFDLRGYMGLWYEIARYPNRFEKGCRDVTAAYALNASKGFSVVNACVTDNGEKVATGRARVPDPAEPAKAEVSFFGPFFGDYWVLDLDDEAGISLVGEPSGRYLWILARTPSISDADKEASLNTLKSLGYRTEALYFTPQSTAR